VIDVTMDRAGLIRLWDRFGLLAIVLASWVFFAIFAAGFTSDFNLYAFGRSVAIWIVVGLAQMVVLAIGQMNISLGAIAGVVAMILGWLLEGWGIPWPIAAAMGVIAGFGLGVINGVIIVTTGINAFIVTLGSGSVFTGLMYIATKADAFRSLPRDFLGLRAEHLLGQPISWLGVVMVIVALALWGLYYGTTVGRQMLATGANRRAARMAGVPTDRMIVLTHGLSGALAGVAGMMLVLRLGSAIPSIGEEFLLPSFAAPAIGGTLLSGGAVAVMGTVLGGLLIGTIENGLNLLDIPNFWVQLVTGLVLLLAVLLDRARTVAVERSRVVRDVSLHEHEVAPA
jgi:ribose transport system permease protein